VKRGHIDSTILKLEVLEMSWKRIAKQIIKDDPNHVYPKFIMSDYILDDYVSRAHRFIEGNFDGALKVDKEAYIKTVNKVVAKKIAMVLKGKAFYLFNNKLPLQIAFQNPPIAEFYLNTRNDIMPPVTDLSVIDEIERIIYEPCPSKQDTDTFNDFLSMFESYRKRVKNMNYNEWREKQARRVGMTVQQQDEQLKAYTKAFNEERDLLTPRTIEERELASVANPLIAEMRKQDKEFYSSFLYKVRQDGLAAAYRLVIQVWNDVAERNAYYEQQEELRRMKNAMWFGMGFQNGWNNGKLRDAERKTKNNKPNGFWD
jgi:hypothetical protein